jgi:hypothetical protein
MIRDKNNAKLAGFYRTVAAYMLKRGKINLSKIMELLPKQAHQAFSYMQWQDAKQWFMTLGGSPLEYRLKSHLQQATLTELFTMINDYYDDSKTKS